MADLVIPLKAIYFDQIKAGVKTEEYRLRTEYWRKRLVGKAYDCIVLTKGYPSRDDHQRRLRLPYAGFVEKEIIHPHFGDAPVTVYAIDVSGPETPGQNP